MENNIKTLEKVIYILKNNYYFYITKSFHEYIKLDDPQDINRYKYMWMVILPILKDYFPSLTYTDPSKVTPKTPIMSLTLEGKTLELLHETVPIWLYTD